MEVGDASVGGDAVRTLWRRRSDKPYKGIRMRKWGKWVAEIREPNKRSRIWLGSYSTAVAVARAYDTAVYYLRGPTAKLNFPDEISAVGLKDLSAASIRQKAAEVGARVDASLAAAAAHAIGHHESIKPFWFQDEIDFNKKPDLDPPPKTGVLLIASKRHRLLISSKRHTGVSDSHSRAAADGVGDEQLPAALQ